MRKAIKSLSPFPERTIADSAPIDNTDPKTRAGRIGDAVKWKRNIIRAMRQIAEDIFLAVNKKVAADNTNIA